MAFYHRAYWSLRCRDPIAVNFLSQGWANIPRLWKTFPLQFQYLVTQNRVIFFLLVSSFTHSEEIKGWFLRVPSCPSWFQLLLFLRARTPPISFSKSADSNSLSQCDSVRLPTHPAVVNPVFTNLLQGLPPYGPLITQCYTPPNEVQGPARQSPKNSWRSHRSRGTHRTPPCPANRI